MLRIFSSALRGTTRATSFPAITRKCKISPIVIKSDAPTAGFASRPQSLLSSTLLGNYNTNACNRYSTLFSQPTSKNILSPEIQVTKVPVRTVTKFSLKKGRRKSVKAVIRRFYRLGWGMWIRTKAGRHKRMWKKSVARKRRSRRHVMTTATQSRLLDTMVTKYWRRRTYYVDDPYNPYHERESYWVTRNKPQPA